MNNLYMTYTEEYTDVYRFVYNLCCQQNTRLHKNILIN